ncbi:MAG: hypothetical protein AAF581_00575 [Planctomycetota bacterium]
MDHETAAPVAATLVTGLLQALAATIFEDAELDRGAGLTGSSGPAHPPDQSTGSR